MKNITEMTPEEREIKRTQDLTLIEKHLSWIKGFIIIYTILSVIVAVYLWDYFENL